MFSGAITAACVLAIMAGWAFNGKFAFASGNVNRPKVSDPSQPGEDGTSEAGVFLERAGSRSDLKGVGNTPSVRVPVQPRIDLWTYDAGSSAQLAAPASSGCYWTPPLASGNWTLQFQGPKGEVVWSSMQALEAGEIVDVSLAL
ncbi:MAG: hypothetical protein WD226_01075 [Planctomycetota bacterium]